MKNEEVVAVFVLIASVALCILAALSIKIYDAECRLNTKIQILETKIDMLKIK